MLIQSIELWLTVQGDYQAGLELLKQTGFSGFTLGILSKGDDTYNRSRLETELRTWVDKQKSLRPIARPSSPGPTMVTGDNSVSTAEPANTSPRAEPDAVTALRQRTYQLQDERRVMQAHIYATIDRGNSEAEMAIRRPWAYRIKAITRELDEIFSQLNFYKQNGYLPLVADHKLAIDDRAALMNVRSYVSRYMAKLKKKNLTPEQRQNAEKLLRQYSDEKERLERKFHNSNGTHTTGQQTQDCPNDHFPLPGP